MSRNLRLIIFIAIGVVIVTSLILLLIFRSQRSKEAKTNINQLANQAALTNATSPEAIQEAVLETTPALTAEEVGIDRQLKSLARNFVERYGSYSNESNLENLTELQGQMADAMKVVARLYRTELEAEFTQYSGHYGITTTVLVSKFINLDEAKGQATLLLTTQRLREVTGKEIEKYTQDVSISLAKEGDSWLVANLAWQ